MKKGFSLVELLVVISIIGVLIGLSIFGLQGARETSRDARRKADLEQIRSGLEMYKADCNKYPSSLSTTLVGGGAACPSTSGNTYISSVPTDPTSSTRRYAYSSPTTTSYVLCASLEQDPGMDASGCGSCATTCNYKVTNP